MSVFASFFLKSIISSLVLLMLSSRLFSAQHRATLLISSAYEFSLFENWSMTVVSSATITRVLLGVAVVGLQHEKEGAQHTALGDSSIEQSSGDLTPNPIAVSMSNKVLSAATGTVGPNCRCTFNIQEFTYH